MPSDSNIEVLKQRLLRRGVRPTPKILHALRKKERQKAIRRSKKRALEAEGTPPYEDQRQLADEESLFRTITSEYHAVRKELRRRDGVALDLTLTGKPWESSDGVELREFGVARSEFVGGRLKGEHLNELVEMLNERNNGDRNWLLENDVEEMPAEDRGGRFLPSRMSREEDKIKFIVKGLSCQNISIQDWKFSRLMKLSGLLFTEKNLLRIVDDLGALGNWRQAMHVVEWVYSEKGYRHLKSRFVYTKLLAVLGKARRSHEALKIFKMMREDYQIYPDMAAYHSIAVTLGQAGLVKELINVIECMKEKPSRRLKNMWRKNWDPCLQPDIIIYNAVLNACVPSCQWKGVFWVLEKMRSSGLKPNGPTYGLAMEVMLESGKYDLVHTFFEKMKRAGLALKALTYKILVKTFWKEGKIDDAIDAVRDMEQRGVVGAGGVYYELACCLCHNGRWKEAMLEVEKLKRLSLSKSLEVAFTGMIQSSMDGGYYLDGISIFEHMKCHCVPNTGTINIMLKVYSQSDMFSTASSLFETLTRSKSLDTSYGYSSSLVPDAYSYFAMLEACASSHQWEYFEYVYREMILSGYKLNLDRHTWLLVEASRAGKWHLLEHAFDAIVDQGEVPHVGLFTEMICQTIFRQNYEQAILLVDSMAYTSMQVSEKRWANLFNRNKDRINQDNLHMFLNALEESSVVMEAPVSSLLKSLKSICRAKISSDASKLFASIGVEEEEASLLADDNTGTENRDSCGHLYLPDMVDRVNKDIRVSDGGSFTTQQNNSSGFGDTCLDGQIVKVASDFCIDGSSGEKRHSDLDDSSEFSSTELTLDLLTSQFDSSSKVTLPSASEILNTWKEDRKKDDLFPFQV